jgi:hypothetical protein
LIDVDDAPSVNGPRSRGRAMTDPDTATTKVRGTHSPRAPSGQVVRLDPGDSGAVPEGASHADAIPVPLTAVEAADPTARAGGRDIP